MKLYYSQTATSKQFVDIELKYIKSPYTNKWGMWAFCTQYSMHLLTGTTIKKDTLLRIFLYSTDKKDLALLDVYKNLLQGLLVEVSGYIGFYTFSTKLTEILMEMVKIKENQTKE